MKKLPRATTERFAPPPASAEGGRRSRRVIRRRGVALASSGLLLSLGAVWCVHLFGFLQVDLRTWLTLVGVTLVVQGLLFLLLERGWEESLGLDPHFVYLPTAAFIGLFGLYIYAIPEIGVYALMSWPVALLFVIGFVGFLDVAVLSTLMALAYVVALTLSAAQVEWSRAAAAGAIFLVINLFSAVMHERLRRKRLEMRALRVALADQALTDALTGLPNRRYLEGCLRGELDRVQRYGSECSIAMLDIDNFKNYNDTLGHVAGDRVLRELAGQMNRHLRAVDVLTRYGGEEFALVMPSTSPGEAVRAVERLRQMLESHPFPGEEVQPGGRLTVSAGVATAPQDGLDFAQLVEAADAVLYLAKRGGRNRVEQTQPQPAPASKV